MSLPWAAVALIGVFAAYAWVAVASERHALRVEINEQRKALALALEDEIDVVRSHVFIAQKTVEHALIRSGGSNKDPQSIIKSESAGLLADPKAKLDQGDDLTILSSATKMLPAIAAAHQWNPIFQWTYFYDAKGQWSLIYPFLPQEELLRVTKTGDMSAAMRVFFDADGTRPLEMIGPRKNSERKMRWTPSYEDAAGKGRMVSLLAPVYLADRFVGAVGTDVTLKQLDEVLHTHPIIAGRSLVVNELGNVISESGGALQGIQRKLPLAELYPELAAGLPTSDHPEWQRQPLRGTTSTLLVHAPDSALNRVAIKNLLPSLIMAAALVLAVFGVVWLQRRRRVDLDATVESLEETRQALVQADRLGGLGGLIAGVGREIDAPLRQATQAVGNLNASLAAFREQQQRGLRRTELDDFIQRVEQNGAQLTRQIDEAADLLQRFRQLAVDQASEGVRRFNLRGLTDNVLAVLRPALKRKDLGVNNAIPADLDLDADAGAIGQALHHLLADAVERSRPGDQLRLSAGWNSDRHGEMIELTLADTAAAPPDLASDSLTLVVRLVQQSLAGTIVHDSDAEGHRLVLRVPVGA